MSRLAIFAILIPLSLSSFAGSYRFEFETSGTDYSLFKIREQAMEFKAYLTLPSGKKFELHLPVLRNRDYYYVYDLEDQGKLIFEFETVSSEPPSAAVIVTQEEYSNSSEHQAYRWLSKAAQKYPLQSDEAVAQAYEYLLKAYDSAETEPIIRTLLLNLVAISIDGNRLQDAKKHLNRFPNPAESPSENGWYLRAKAEIFNAGGDMSNSRDTGYASVKSWEKAYSQNPFLEVELGETIAHICDALIFLGSNDTLECLDRALIYVKGHTELEALIQNNKGGYYIENFKYAQALSALEESARLYVAASDNERAAQAIYNSGYIFLRQGQFNRALDRYYKALNTLQSRNADGIKVYVYRSIAKLHLLLGDLEKASYYLRNAQELLHDHDQRAISASIHQSLGEVEYRRGNYEAALAFHRTYLAYHDDLDSEDNSYKARARIDLARDLIKLERITDASAANASALKLALAPLVRGDVLLNQAEIRIAENRLPEAQESAKKALRLFKSHEHDVAAVEAASLLADSFRKENNWPRAIKAGQEAMELAEKATNSFQDISVGREYLSKVHHVYSSLVHALVQDYKLEKKPESLERAFLVAERGRAFHLLRIAKGSEFNGGNGIHSLSQQLVGLNNLYLEKHDAGDFSSANDFRMRIDTLEHQMNLAQRNAQLQESWQWPSIEALRSKLGPDSLYVAYLIGDEVNYGFTLDANSLAVFDLPPSEILIASTEKALTTIKNMNSFDRQLIKNYSDLVLGKHIQHSTARHLVIVPDGYLHHLPFAALDLEPEHASYIPLISNYSVNLTPALQIQGTRDVTRNNTIAIVVAGAEGELSQNAGDSDNFRTWSRQLGGLPWALQEAKQIQSIFLEQYTQILANEQASLEGLKSSGALEADILHFATHGYISDSDPNFVGLVLTQPSTRLPEFVSWRNFATLDIQAQLVVLNACDTGLGRQLNGEGLLGLSYAFMNAGAQETLTTLWEIADRPASLLMQKFYVSLKTGMTTSEALRQAQISLKDSKYWHPFFWSGYVAHTASY